MNPCGCLCGVQADKWAKQIGPTGKVGPITGRDKGGVIRPNGRCKVI